MIDLNISGFEHFGFWTNNSKFILWRPNQGNFWLLSPCPNQTGVLKRSFFAHTQGRWHPSKTKWTNTYRTMAIDGPSYTLPVLGEISPIPLANFWVLSLDPVLFLRDYDDCPISLDSSPLPEWYFISIGCLAPPRLHPGCSATFYTSTPSSPSKLHNPVLLPTLVLGTPALYLPCKVIWTFF